MTEKGVLDLSPVELASLQIEQYHQNGYLVLESIIPESVCDALKTRMSELTGQIQRALFLPLMSSHDTQTVILSSRQIRCPSFLRKRRLMKPVY